MHCEASYDSKLPISEIVETSRSFGFNKIGITDHLNYNNPKFLGDLKTSAELVKQWQPQCDRLVLGVELTPIAKPLFEHLAKYGSVEGYVPPSATPYEMELAQTKEELKALGVRYAVAAAHWRVDIADINAQITDVDICLKEWHRQQMWLACDERVTILGHPWYHGKGIWYADFSIIPRLHVEELAAALKENGKYVECNGDFFVTPATTEKFRNQYAEFLRELFEMGIPVTYGSDSHNTYKPSHIETEQYLRKAGFVDGDISELDESVFW